MNLLIQLYNNLTEDDFYDFINQSTPIKNEDIGEAPTFQTSPRESWKTHNFQVFDISDLVDKNPIYACLYSGFEYQTPEGINRVPLDYILVSEDLEEIEKTIQRLKLEIDEFLKKYCSYPDELLEFIKKGINLN